MTERETTLSLNFFGDSTEELEIQLREVQRQLEDLPVLISKLRAEIAKRKKQKLVEDIEKDAFDFDVLMTVTQFEIRDSKRPWTWQELRYMVYKIHGPDATYPLRFWQQSIYSRSYCTGDISWHEYDDARYKKLLTLFLTKHACRYCKKLCHEIEKCPILDKQRCEACGRTRHTTAKCKDLDALRRYATGASYRDIDSKEKYRIFIGQPKDRRGVIPLEVQHVMKASGIDKE